MSSELFVSRLYGATWAAVREDGRTVELRVESEAPDGSIAGRIVLGRVTRVLPGMQVAFLDVGLDRVAFLHVDDLLLPGEEPIETRVPADPDLSDDDAADGEVVSANEAAEDEDRRRAVRRKAPIQDRLREGRDLLVQITRAPIRSKGARVSSYITLPGRYLVHLPQLALRGVSRRVGQPAERDRLRDVLENLDLRGGFIARTAAEGVSAEVLRSDARRLVDAWGRIERAAAAARPPALIHADRDLLIRMLREAPAGGYDAVVLDDPADRHSALEYLRGLDPDAGAGVRLDPSSFEHDDLRNEIERAVQSRVWLRSGGYLVIEQTEALVSIDVNSGKYVGKRHPEETALRINLEAAVEIARQLRLRDLGGIIVVDFIDMERSESRRQVIDALTDALRGDRTRTKIVGLSELGLLQLTRKRTRPGPGTILTRRCPTCAGEGRIRTPEVVAWDALRRVRELTTGREPERITVRVHPDVASALRTLWITTAPPDGEPLDIAPEIDADDALAPDSFEIDVV